MDGQEEVVVHGSSEDIGADDEDSRERARVTQPECYRKLAQNDAQHNPLREGFVTHELCDLNTR